MSRYISEKKRKSVEERANNRCEYCKSFSKLSFFSFHIEHIISIKHGGTDTLENLALSCPICNLNKGSDLGTVLENPNQLVRFFNPRTDIWNEHFEIHQSGLIEPKTPEGITTIKILNLNHPDSIIERKAMIEKNIYF